MNQVEQLFDRYATGYHDKFNTNPISKYQRERVVEILTPYFRSARSVLDIGCGPGSDFETYARFDLNVTALDISAEMTRLATEQAARINPDIKIHNCAIEDFESNTSFDLLIMNFGVINVIQDLEALALKLQRLVNTNGILAVTAMPAFQIWRRLSGQKRFASTELIEQRVEVRYDFAPDKLAGFEMISRTALGWLLPTPDQFARLRIRRWLLSTLKHIDRKLGAYLPKKMGADHELYIFRKSES